LLWLALLSAPAVGAQVFQPINSFTGCDPLGCDVGNDGQRPGSTLVAGPDGNFYGTTFGFPGSNGTVYRVTPSGARTTLINFDAAPLTDEGFPTWGAFPVGRLALGPDGNFYGVTDQGGLYNGGVLFRVAPGGGFDLLHHFQWPTASSPSGGPVFTADGDLFGVTGNGGDLNQGTVFKWNGSALTTIHSFGTTTAGSYPAGDLMLASDGSVYGAAVGGGSVNEPTLFRITPAESVERFHLFTSTEGTPYGSLLQASDGFFYGATFGGSLYRITSGSVLTTLHDSQSFDGNLLEGFGGVIYGTTRAGGTSNKGTLFRMTPDGSLTTLHSFSGADGQQPPGGGEGHQSLPGLVRGADRHLYGTAYAGGTNDLGVFFRLAMPPAVDVTANGSQGPVTIPAGGPLTIRFAVDAPGTGVINPAHLLAGFVTPFGVLWLGPTGFGATPVVLYSGPLPAFGPSTLLSFPSTAAFPPGNYQWFVLIIDAAASRLLGDSVQTVVPPPG
jgi:uncharacterized repeat protein (TIGR03803 family)